MALSMRVGRASGLLQVGQGVDSVGALFEKRRSKDSPRGGAPTV